MVLKIGDEPEHQIWHLHFHTYEEPTDEERGLQNLPPLLYDISTSCLAHTGACVFTVPDSTGRKYCINGHAGTAHCSKKDQFVKAVAHKTALRRALIGLGKEVRRQIWQAYGLRVRRPKETPEHFRRRLLLAQKAA